MNLDIEGTKHEKVVIILLAYVMGFTAGFICFGVANSMRERTEAAPTTYEHVPEMQAINSAEHESLAPTSEPVESPVAAEATEPVTPVEPADPSTLVVTYKDGKLQASVGQNEYLLSMKSSGLDSAAASAFKNQGMHTDIPAYKVSPDNHFVYFCEQHGSDDSCTSFIFDVTRNIIEYVSVAGTKLPTTAAIAKAASWSPNGLTIDNKTSVDASIPAILAKTN